jgi:hypothetical protein
VKLPNLYSFVRDQRISVKNVLQVEDLDSLFMLPLCAQAFAEFQDLEAELQALPLAVGQHDVWSFIWGNSVYSSSKFYALVFKNMDVEPSFSWLWKSKCTPRIKFFGWLLLVDRLNTRIMLRRRHFHLDSGYACAMCNTGAEEDISHLFFNCPFATSCWQKLRLRWPNIYDLHEKIAFGRKIVCMASLWRFSWWLPRNCGTYAMIRSLMVLQSPPAFGFANSRSKLNFNI